MIYIYFLNCLLIIVLLNINKIMSYFNPKKFNSEELIFSGTEIPINLIKIKKVNLEEIISYINIYCYKHKNIKLEFLMKEKNLNIIFLAFFPTLTSIYLICLYFKFKKIDNLNKLQKNFFTIYINKHSWIFNISLIYCLLTTKKISFLYNYFHKLLKSWFFIFNIFSFLLIINLLMIKLYKHYIFIEELKKINFMKRDEILYIHKNQLNLLINIIDNI